MRAPYLCDTCITIIIIYFHCVSSEILLPCDDNSVSEQEASVASKSGFSALVRSDFFGPMQETLEIWGVDLFSF